MERAMNMIYAIPDQGAIRYPQFSPEAEMTPIDCLEAGEYWAVESITKWMQADEREHELRDLLIERQSDIIRDSLRQKWAKAVQRGEA
jgi:hypothetical protein